MGETVTVADYMRDALTHPDVGYYTQPSSGDGAVFGADGDFVTSPEISQMFGELVGVWAATVWQSLGRPKRLRLVELGPGRGTLMDDLIRAAASVPGLGDALEVHLVEVSASLRAMQRRTICGDEDGDGERVAHASSTGSPVMWHGALSDVPGGDDVPAVHVAHEFFDALPVHQLHRTPHGWREAIVGPEPNPASPRHLRLYLSRDVTPASLREEGRSPMGAPGARSRVERCLAGEAIAVELARRVGRDGGAALVVDYGRDGPYDDSLVAIRRHGGAHPLSRPGRQDLTAWVDFNALRTAAEGAALSSSSASLLSPSPPAPAPVAVHGPVEQGLLLRRLGIDARLASLLRSATPKQAEALRIGHARLTGGGGGGMGRSYLALAIASSNLGTPVGFEVGVP